MPWRRALLSKQTQSMPTRPLCSIADANQHGSCNNHNASICTLTWIHRSANVFAPLLPSLTHAPTLRCWMARLRSASRA
jgi:hypothetical protein